jgi:magnesium transporter
MLEYLLKPEIQDLIREKDFAALHDVLVRFEPAEIAYLINELPSEEVVFVFRLLPRDLATDTFAYLSHEKQQALIESLAHETDRLASLANDLSPDDRTALLEELPGSVSQRLLAMLSPQERKVAVTLLGYPEASVGRLMTPEYVAVRSEWTVQQALDNIRQYGTDSETLNVIYVVDDCGHLVDDLHIRKILLAPLDASISDLMDRRFVALKATDDQETAVKVFRDYDVVALPVTDTQGVLVGIVTVDDVLDVAAEEATEDIQKIGGSEALEEPYMNARFTTLVKKRARWLVGLFLGEILTATAMGHFQKEIARAVVLALFVPLIISSGGNSGSQAATLIIRAMALGEVRLRDWWHVMRREICSGLALGSILGAIGVMRVSIWQMVFHIYGEHWLRIGFTVGISLVGVVLWGTLSGSMLPLAMRRLGVDPAASSAPFVATLVDVTGIVIYFSVATLLLTGTLL